MKINREISNVRNTSSKQAENVKRSATTQNQLENQKIEKNPAISNQIVSNVISSVKNTFSLQNQLSMIQQKKDAVETFIREDDFSVLEKGSFNNQPLFNNKELESMKTSSASLDSILDEYSKQEAELNQSISANIVQNENSNAATIEKDVENIRDYLSNALAVSMKQESSVILDLLK